MASLANPASWLAGYIPDMSPATRLPVAQLNDAAKVEVANAIAALAEEDLASAYDASHARPGRDRACNALPDDRP